MYNQDQSAGYDCAQILGGCPLCCDELRASESGVQQSNSAVSNSESAEQPLTDGDAPSSVHSNLAAGTIAATALTVSLLSVALNRAQRSAAGTQWARVAGLQQFFDDAWAPVGEPPFVLDIAARWAQEASDRETPS